MSWQRPIAETEFVRLRRDPLYSYAGYSGLIGELAESAEVVTEENIALRLAHPGSPQDNIAAVRSATEQRAWEGVELLHALFSSGVPAASVAAVFPEVLRWWEVFAKYDRMFDDSPGAAGRRVPHLDLYDKGYWKAIRLTSFALLLGRYELLPRVAALWDYENDDLDGLLERLVAPFVPGRAPPPDTCTRHLPYFKLLKVFAAAPDKRPELMSKYMDEWYTASRREPYFESHKKGREHSYLGLWSFEAAAVTYVLQIDDSTYRDKDFYPRDLIDYACSLPLPAELGGPAVGSASPFTSTGLRCQAGEACPRSGWWLTPAKAESRRRFEQGTIMPAIGGDYGSTIWQWDDRQID
jgi:hypothetical protein